MELSVEILAGVMTTLCGVISLLFWRYVSSMQSRIDDYRNSNERKESTIRSQAETIRAYAEEVGALKRKLNGDHDHD